MEYTKKCKNFKRCGKMRGDSYDYCRDCNNQFGKDNAIIEIAKTLKQINWNLGLRNEFYKQENPKKWEAIEKDWKEKARKNEEEEKEQEDKEED